MLLTIVSFFLCKSFCQQLFLHLSTIIFTLYLCFCYLKPYQCKEVSEDIFTKLASDIAYFQKQGEVLVNGDFNARTGNLYDYISHDSISDTFLDCPLPATYISDSVCHRNNTDTQTNLHGELLTKLCKNFNLKILNGRFLGDSLGYCTFHNSKGSSCVDYMLASNHVFHNVLNFKVLPPTELSDHSIICTREKGRYLTKSYDKSHYTHRKIQKAT